MNRQSEMWLIALAGIAALTYYNSLMDVPSMMALARALGLSGFYLLCLSLIIGPLYTIWPKEFGQIVEPRRALGIAAFIFIVLHYFIVISSYFNYDFSMVISETGLVIAVPALLIFLAMTLTSNNWAVGKMGKHWKTLQRLVYIAFILSLAHFVLKANGLNPGAKTGLNLAEAALLVLAAATIVLQIAGFMKKSSAKAKGEA